jgi:hypothetical protein
MSTIWLDHYRRFWSANLASLKAFVEAEYAKETKPPRTARPTIKVRVSSPQGER